ncbi:Uncharacterised protein [Cedecea neteri]|uniref:Uncharacterized protein n=1 Tax=Cedecea neteri TaxID=158822 RepID=A0A2X2V6J0_9ENTR|nr:Uncharacterised protein [Cedecea neteri]
MCPGVRTDNFCVRVHACGNFPGRALVGFNQAKTSQVRQGQRPFTAFVSFAFGASFRDVTESIRADISEALSVFGSTDAERVQHHNKRTFHIILRTLCSI